MHKTKKKIVSRFLPFFLQKWNVSICILSVWYTRGTFARVDKQKPGEVGTYTEEGPPVFPGDFAGNLPQNEVQGVLQKWWFLFWYHADFSLLTGFLLGRRRLRTTLMWSPKTPSVLCSSLVRSEEDPHHSLGGTQKECVSREEGTEGCSIRDQADAWSDSREETEMWTLTFTYQLSCSCSWTKMLIKKMPL